MPQTKNGSHQCSTRSKYSFDNCLDNRLLERGSLWRYDTLYRYVIEWNFSLALRIEISFFNYNYNLYYIKIIYNYNYNYNRGDFLRVSVSALLAENKEEHDVSSYTTLCSFLQETEGLEQKKQSLQEEIQQLQQAKDELEFILEAHRAVCRRSLRSSSPLDVKPIIKSDLPPEEFAAEPVKGDTTMAAATRPNRPNSLPVGLDNNNRLSSLSMFTEPKERPDTLAFKTVETPSFMKPSMDVAGMPITTPTSGIPFNFESLMEGGTGLTPVSTPLIPSCSTQQRNNLSAVDLSSPDANPPKLVSLWRHDHTLEHGSNEENNDPEWRGVPWREENQFFSKEQKYYWYACVLYKRKKIFDCSRKMFHVFLYRFHCADFVDNYYICKNLMNCDCL